MNSGNDPRLGGFEQRLLSELRDFVELRAASHAEPLLTDSQHRRHIDPKPPPRLAALPRALSTMTRRLLATASVAALAGCAAVLIGISSGASPSLALAKEFPAFAMPPTNVSGFLSGILRDQGGAAAQVDASHARAIATPLGTGYVATDTQANLICIATPGFNKDWGANCGKVSQAERNGVGAPEIFDSSGHSVAWAEVLPKGATATARDANGKTTPVLVSDGVLAIVVHHLTFITTHIAGHANTMALATQSECDPITQQGTACKVLAEFYAKRHAARAR